MPQPAPAAPLPFARRRPWPCATCGAPIKPTGRRGRPARRCPACREAGAPAPPPPEPSAEQRYDLALLASRKAVNVAEAAAMIGWSTASLYAAWARGEGPPRFKDGAKVTIPTAGLDRWLEERAAAAEAAEGGR